MTSIAWRTHRSSPSSRRFLLRKKRPEPSGFIFPVKITEACPLCFRLAVTCAFPPFNLEDLRGLVDQADRDRVRLCHGVRLLRGFDQQ